MQTNIGDALAFAKLLSSISSHRPHQDSDLEELSELKVWWSNKNRQPDRLLKLKWPKP